MNLVHNTIVLHGENFEWTSHEAAGKYMIMRNTISQLNFDNLRLAIFTI